MVFMRGYLGHLQPYEPALPGTPLLFRTHVVRVHRGPIDDSRHLDLGRWFMVCVTFLELYGSYPDLQNAPNHDPTSQNTSIGSIAAKIRDPTPPMLSYSGLGHYFGPFWASRYVQVSGPDLKAAPAPELQGFLRG